MANFPAQSPGLNPVECVWALLDAKLAERFTEQNDAALMAVTKAERGELDQAYAISFRSKCPRQVASEGF